MMKSRNLFLKIYKKFEEILTKPFFEKLQKSWWQTDRPTDRQTDRQTDIQDLLIYATSRRIKNDYVKFCYLYMFSFCLNCCPYKAIFEVGVTFFFSYWAILGNWDIVKEKLSSDILVNSNKVNFLSLVSGKCLHLSPIWVVLSLLGLCYGTFGVWTRFKHFQ